MCCPLGRRQARHPPSEPASGGQTCLAWEVNKACRVYALTLGFFSLTLCRPKLVRPARRAGKCRSGLQGGPQAAALSGDRRHGLSRQGQPEAGLRHRVAGQGARLLSPIGCKLCEFSGLRSAIWQLHQAPACRWRTVTVVLARRPGRTRGACT